jgi:hypothetical protein
MSDLYSLTLIVGFCLLLWAMLRLCEWLMEK